MKTLKQKLARSKARAKVAKKVFHVIPACNYYARGTYHLFDEITKEYWSVTKNGFGVLKHKGQVLKSKNKKDARVNDWYTANEFIKKYGWTGAWRAIKINK